LQGHVSINTLTGQHVILPDKFSFEKWMSKVNSFLDKFKITSCKIQINGQMAPSEIMISKLAKITALYESFELDDDCIANLKLPEGEQVAQMELYAGSIGFIKNPKSHKMLTLLEDKCIELLHLANYLLRILSEN